MSFPFAHVGRHLLASRELLGRRQVQVAIAFAAFATVLSVILAPDTTPSTWDWIRIILIGLFGLAGVLTFANARSVRATDPDERQVGLMAAAVAVALAIIVNLTFTVGTALIFSVGITIVALVASEDRDLRSSWMVIGALLAVIPFWVWSALEAWTWGLFLLAPLAVIGIISDGHMRAASGLTPDPEPLLSRRGHRLASWAGILGSAILVLGFGLVSDAANGVVALGAAGAIILVALEAGSPVSDAKTSRASVAIADCALVWIALCWIVSL